MSRFLVKRLESLEAYTPGEQPASRQNSGKQATDEQNSGSPVYIKLNTNESPYPPPPGVLAALNESELYKLNLYPNPDGTELIKKISDIYNVLPDNVIIGNGSDELLAFSFLAFFGNGIVFPDITYGFYSVYANLFNIPYKQIPLCDDFSINVNNYINIGENIVIANPNAPTGIALSQSDVEAILKSNPDRLILIDEAYVDFGTESAIPLLSDYDNLLIIHTYSKARSMAGARLSYAISAKPIIDDLKKIKYSFNPYNVNTMTQILGLEALKETNYYKKMHSEIIRTRCYASNRLSELGFTMTDSKANFLFVKNPEICGKELYQSLKKKGILVRHWNLQRISDYVRITVGTKEQMDSLCIAISEVLCENN